MLQVTPKQPIKMTLLNKKLEQENKNLEKEASEIRGEFEKLKNEKKMLVDRFAYISQELFQSHKTTKHLKKKNQSLEKVIDKLERDVKQAQDVIDKKKTRSCEVISANKGLYSQIIAAKIKPKATSRA